MYAPRVLCGAPALRRAAERRLARKMTRRRKLLGIAADWASEPPARIAQNKRIGACHPQRQVHALLAAFINCTRFIVLICKKHDKRRKIANPILFDLYAENC